MARAALVALAVTGCLHGSPPGAACTQLTDRCVGHAIDQVMMTAYWNEYDDRALAAYVAGVGQRLLRAAGRTDRWRFRVLDVPDANGQANLDTTVYVTRGALARLRSEAELAGLLGHEIGHVLAGHGHEAIAEGERRAPRSDGDRVLRAARDDEIQADELAVLLASRAGYEPRAVETMLRALAAGDPRTEPDPDDPHPGWVERLARVRAFAARLPHGELGGRRYLAAIAGLVVGDDPRELAVVGSAVVLARAGLAFDLPAGAPTEPSSEGLMVGLGDGAAVIRPISSRFARYLAPKRTADVWQWVARGPHGAALVVVTAKDPARAAALLQHATRAPRADELAALHPARVDLGAPRPLWPD